VQSGLADIMTDSLQKRTQGKGLRYTELLIARAKEQLILPFVCAGCGRASVDPHGRREKGQWLCSRCATPESIPAPPPEKAVFFPPGLERPRKEDLARLSTARSIDEVPLTIAADRGFVWCYDDKLNGRCWIYTDQRRKCGLRRRLDNKPFTLKNGSEAKSVACAGSDMTSPLGLEEARGFPCFGIAEGSPNGLAVLAQAWASGVEARVSPIVMPCAGSNFSETHLAYLQGKRGRIFADNDGPGWNAALRWHAQLQGGGIDADAYSFEGLTKTDGARVKDLNDFCQLDYDCWEQYRTPVEAVMGFATEERVQP
jgi:hypothetical protein